MSKRKYDALQMIQKHIHKSKEYLDKLKESATAATLEKQLRELQRAVDAYASCIEEFEAEKRDFGIAMLDLCKHREINVSASHKKLKTAPWTTGKEQYDEEQAKLHKEKEKKKKKKKH